MKKLFFLLSLVASTRLYAMDAPLLPPPDRNLEPVKVVCTDFTSSFDVGIYNRFVQIIKADIARTLPSFGNRKLPDGVNMVGFCSLVFDCLDHIEKKDSVALQGIYKNYMRENKHEKFCELVLASHILGIDFIVTEAQSFFKNDYKLLIDQDDSTFFVKLLIFQRNRFPALGNLDHLLGYAAATGKSEIVKTLLVSKASVDLLDSEGVTPLIHAAKNGHLKVVAHYLLPRQQLMELIGKGILLLWRQRYRVTLK